ncbi:MAG: hypothetical protein ACYC0U_04810 [Ilumatobacteraceae bacterium]
MRILSPLPLRQLLRFGVAVTAATLACGVAPAFATSGVGNDASSGSTETSVYTYNLPGNVNDCVGLYPKPNCGTEPLLSGDRGGVMQYATFGAIIAGLGFIMTVIARSVIRTDRAKARQAEVELQKPSQPKFNN